MSDDAGPGARISKGAAGGQEKGAIPTPPWRRTPRKRDSPRRRPVTQDLIIDACLRVVDEEGLDALNMRRIAEELDTGPATIYAHFASKEELLESAVDRVIGEVDLPEPAPDRWPEQVRGIALDLFRALNSHRDLARASLAGIPTGPNALDLGEWLLGVMVAGGVALPLATWAIDRILLYVEADAFQGSLYVAKLPSSDRSHGERVADYIRQIRDFYASLPAERFPYTAQHADQLVAGSGDDRFQFGLTLLLDGLVARVNRQARAPKHP